MRVCLAGAVLGVLGAMGLQAVSQTSAPAAPPAPATGWAAAMVLRGEADAAAAQIKLDATPALWRINGGKGAVYLFGTTPSMKKDVHLQTAKMRAALESSDLVYLEVGGETAEMNARHKALIERDFML